MLYMTAPKTLPLPSLGGLLMPGWIEFKRVRVLGRHTYWDVPFEGTSIVKPDDVKSGDNEHKDVLFGMVTDCAETFCEHNGTHHSPEDLRREGVLCWPLPVGTWATFRNAMEWQVGPDVYVLNTKDMIKSWLPPEYKKKIRKPDGWSEAKFESMFGPPAWDVKFETQRKE